MRPSEALRRNRDAARVLLSRYPVANPMIFGSTARGEDTEASDLDIVVERGGLRSYSELFEIEDALTALLGVRVDLHTTSEFGQRFNARISTDLQAL